MDGPSGLAVRVCERSGASQGLMGPCTPQLAKGGIYYPVLLSLTLDNRAFRRRIRRLSKALKQSCLTDGRIITAAGPKSSPRAVPCHILHVPVFAYFQSNEITRLGASSTWRPYPRCSGFSSELSSWVLAKRFG